MSSCLVIEQPVYPLLVRVNCEPRTRSLSIARALSPLANTLEPFLDTFPCVKNAALRANAHYPRTGSRFCCALRTTSPIMRHLEGIEHITIIHMLLQQMLKNTNNKRKQARSCCRTIALYIENTTSARGFRIP